MWNKKRVGFILVIALFLLTLIPGVFALLEFLNYSLYNTTNLIRIYDLWHTWIDFGIFFLIFGSIARVGFKKLYGSEEETGGATGLYVGVGLLLALSLTLLEARIGWKLLNFGPFAALILLFLFLVGLYLFLSGKDKLSLWPALIFLGLTLLLAVLLWPNLFGNIPPWIQSLLGLAIVLTLGAGALWLLAWFISLGRGIFRGRGSGEGRGEREASTERGSRDRGDEGGRNGGRRGGRDRGEERPQPIRLVVNLIANPPRGPYQVGQEVMIKAMTYTDRSSGPPRENLVYAWTVNGQPRNQRIDRIKLTIGANMPQGLNGELAIIAEAIGTETGSRGISDPLILRVTVGTEILRITNPTDTPTTRDLTSQLNQQQNFKFTLEGSVPQDVTQGRWLYLVGRQNNVSLADLGNATLIRDSNANGTFGAVVGQAPLPLQAGQEYTVICVALRGSNFYIRGGGLLRRGQPLLDYFYLLVPPAGGGNVPTPTLGVNNPRAGTTTVDTKNFNVQNVQVGDTLYFVPDIKLNNQSVPPADFTITVTSSVTGPDFNLNKTNNLSQLKIISAGQKTVTYTYRHNPSGRTTTIVATINVSSGGNQPTIQITSPTTNAISKTTPLVVPQGSTQTFEAATNGVSTIMWGIVQNFMTSVPNRALTQLATGNKQQVQMNYGPGNYTIFALGYNTGPLAANDFIHVTIQASGGGNPPKFTLTAFKGTGTKKTAVGNTIVALNGTTNIPINNATLKENYQFEVAIQNDNIANYIVTFKVNTNDALTRYDPKKKLAILNLRDNTWPKIVTCEFSKGGTKAATITITFNQQGGQQNTTVKILRPTANTQLKIGQQVTLTADIQNPGSQQIKVGWLLSPSRITDTNNLSNATPLGVNNNFNLTVPQVTPGAYFLTVVLLGTNNLPLGPFESIPIEILGAQGIPLVTANDTDNNAEIGKDSKDFTINTKVGTKITLTPSIVNGNISDYNVTISYNVNAPDVIRIGTKTSKAMLEINSTNSKLVNYTFQNRISGTTVIIIVKFNAAGPKIKITRINGQKVSTGQTIDAKAGKGKKGSIKMEAEVNDPSFLDYFYWTVQEEGTGTIEPLGIEPVKGYKGTFDYTYFTEDYFKKGKDYILIVAGERTEVAGAKRIEPWQKLDKDRKRITDSSGNVVMDWVKIHVV